MHLQKYLKLKRKEEISFVLKLQKQIHSFESKQFSVIFSIEFHIGHMLNDIDWVCMCMCVCVSTLATFLALNWSIINLLHCDQFLNN